MDSRSTVLCFSQGIILYTRTPLRHLDHGFVSGDVCFVPWIHHNSTTIWEICLELVPSIVAKQIQGYGREDFGIVHPPSPKRPNPFIRKPMDFMGRWDVGVVDLREKVTKMMGG